VDAEFSWEKAQVGCPLGEVKNWRGNYTQRLMPTGKNPLQALDSLRREKLLPRFWIHACGHIFDKIELTLL